MEMYGKGTRQMYTKLWAMECDWKCWRKESLFALIRVYHLNVVQ